MPYHYTIATEAHAAQIHALNHATFAGEIPQHAPTPDGRLVDRFHDENTYLVALDGETVAGMMALRHARPFSLDAKLPDLDTLLPAERPAVEIRLLAVRPERRHGRAFAGLMAYAARWMVQNGFRLALISGTTRQTTLYERMGFRPFGPLVGHGDATYQPMLSTLDDALRAVPPMLASPDRPGPDVSLLPGPVELDPAVSAALARTPVSHRGEAFAALHARVVAGLAERIGLPHVALMVGPGTLANDVVAAHLAAWGAPGLVLSNGAFGERLADHARRHGLAHEVVRSAWGEPLPLDAAADRLASGDAPGWIWAVHGETSTGMLNDVSALGALARGHGARLCLDAVSTLGAVPVDASAAMMATGVSGKALGGVAGLAFVAHGALPPLARPLPAAFDLAAAHDAGGIPFTSSSPLLAALDAALGGSDDARMARLQRQGRRIRQGLTDAGFDVVAPPGTALPTVQTVALGSPEEAWAVGERLERLGILTSYRSGYLRARGWLQLCTMGAQTDAHVEAALAAFCAAVRVERNARTILLNRSFVLAQGFDLPASR